MNRLKSITLSLILAFFLPIPIFGIANTVNAASFEFDPDTNSFPEACNQSINIFADVTGESSNGADLEINYDPNQVEILDSDPNRAGVQILTGNAYDLYVYNSVEENVGRIRVAGASFNSALTSRKLFATIEFKGKPGASFVNFQIKVDGFGSTFSLDSNIADSKTNLDLLTSVTNGNYTFTQGSCSEDTDGPVHTFIKPEAYGTGYVAQNGVIVKLTDFGVGVDITTVVITINGIDYTYNSPEVTYTGDSDSYTFTIVPTSPYPTNTAITAISKASDFAGNSSTKQIVFNIPPGTPVSCPISYVEGEQGTDIPGNFCSIEEQKIIKNLFGDGTIVYRLISNIGTPGIWAVLLGLLGLLWLLPYLNQPFLMWSLLTAYLGRSTNKPWGVVLDIVTKKPVRFAVCRLYKSGTLFLVAQDVSDTEGRYGFIAQEGEYRLEITKGRFTKFIKEITIDQYDRSFVIDVLLHPIHSGTKKEEQGSRGRLRYYRQLLKKIAPYIHFGGFILSILSIFVYPNIFNFFIFLCYLITYILIIYSNLRQPVKTSIVVDSSNDLLVPNALVKIYNQETHQLVDLMVTNDRGEFEFFGEPGEYAIYIYARGYNFPSVIQVNHDKISDKLLKVKLQRGDNELKLMIDPTTDSSTYIIPGSLKSPFN
jgi:hypothetical protein